MPLPRVPSLLAAAALAAAVATPLPVAAAPSPIDPSVDDHFQDAARTTGVPGGAYAVVSPDGIEHLGAWGVDGHGDPVTPDTPFLWGSVAKPVTATAVLTLAEDGALELDDPVRRHLPEFTVADPEASERITVRHLLEQTSGIPRDAGVTDRFSTHPDPYADALADLAEVEPISAPGEEHHYASANYLVLGAVVQAAAEEPFTDYLHARVLDPLGMAGVVDTPQAAAEIPPGHRIVFGRPTAFQTPYDPAGPGYGYLGGSVTDLARFTSAHLDGARSGDDGVLSAESFAEMHTGSATVSDTTRYGLGWRDSSSNDDLGTRTVWHTGAVPGHMAATVLLPEAGLGVVLVQNAHGLFQDDRLVQVALGAARLLAGGDPEPLPSGDAHLGPLAGLAVVALLVWALCVARLRALRRPARRTGRGAALAAAAGALVAAAASYAALSAVPAAFGALLREVLYFAPDVGWLLVGIGAGAGVLAVLCAAHAVRARRAVGGGS